MPYGLLAALDSRSRNSDRQRLADCVEMAESLIKKHGLESWSFQFDNARNRAGCCNYAIRVISLSRLYCLKAGQDQVRDTILHEIAHALAGHEHNHDAKWKSIARSIGCTADRCHSIDFSPAKYIVSCLRCGWHVKKNRRLRGAICRTCNGPATYRHFSEQAGSDARRSAGAGRRQAQRNRPPRQSRFGQSVLNRRRAGPAAACDQVSRRSPSSSSADIFPLMSVPASRFSARSRLEWCRSTIFSSMLSFITSR